MSGGHVVTLPESLYNTILSNIRTLSASGKVALWGMADYAIEFASKIIKQCNDLVLIDLSEEKQLMHINKHKVQAPSYIKENGITDVVILVPDFRDSIKATVKQYYNCENVNIHTIYDLFSPEAFTEGR